MEGRRFHFEIPWTTIYIAVLIAAVTYGYLHMPASIKNNYTLWATSPFNISYELSNNGAFYNYVLVVLIYLFVELYSRNIADLKGRESLIRNAAIFSIVSAYAASAIVWLLVGMPSSGSSILAFNVLLFFAFETYDSELIKRMSEKRMHLRKTIEIVSLAFVLILIAASMVLFVYLNGNEFWYIHILGGAIFAPIYLFYLSRRVRPKVDRFEEVLEKDVEKDLSDVGADLEGGVKKLEKGIEKEVGVK